MKTLLSLLTFLLLAPAVNAAVIFSACPVKTTETPAGAAGPLLVDRFKPDEIRRQVRIYSKELPGKISWLRSFLTDAPGGGTLADAAAVGLWFEDVEFINAISSEGTSCHGDEALTTEALAIFPFVMRVNGTGGQTEYRVRYKLCEYYVDNERQLPIENACALMGRENGYAFGELKERTAQLKRHIEETRTGVNYGVMAAGVVLAVPMFKTARYLRGGAITTLVATGLPMGAAYYAVEMKWTDELIRSLIDFGDAAEVALTGDLSTSVSVNMPIGSFVPYFQRYLDSLD